jgi:hypothetical protein
MGDTYLIRQYIRLGLGRHSSLLSMAVSLALNFMTDLQFSTNYVVILTNLLSSIVFIVAIINIMCGKFHVFVVCDPIEHGDGIWLYDNNAARIGFTTSGLPEQAGVEFQTFLIKLSASGLC